MRLHYREWKKKSRAVSELYYDVIKGIGHVIATLRSSHSAHDAGHERFPSPLRAYTTVRESRVTCRIYVQFILNLLAVFENCYAGQNLKLRRLLKLHLSRLHIFLLRPTFCHKSTM